MTDLEETPEDAPPPPPRRVCAECEGTGSLSRYLGRWTWAAEPCEVCGGQGWTTPQPAPARKAPR